MAQCERGAREEEATRLVGVICRHGFYERLHQFSVGNVAHEGPRADLRPRSSRHLNIGTPQGPNV